VPVMASPAKRGAGAERVRATRQRWGLSQSQFGRLFATSVRTVRRWENGQLDPREHQKWMLALLVRYAASNGIDEFLRRFLHQAGRLSKPGRPCTGDR
jgi:transcriptional regulator with XRE-family HTH domain